MTNRSAIDDARRRHRVLKELVRRERDYTKGYKDLRRLYDIGVLEKGMLGDPTRIAQEVLDALDEAVDRLCFLDILASFEAVAVKRIGEIVAATLGMVTDRVGRADLAPVAPGLVRQADEFEQSLKKIVGLMRIGALPQDAQHLDLITETRNAIAHGRIPRRIPLPHVDLASLLERLVERQLSMHD